jgi:hypothetical protein
MPDRSDLQAQARPYLLNRIDYTGRILVKA